jgi:Amt family ammonium transporter
MTALVQVMTPGVAFFYGGLVGEHAVVHTMMMSFGAMGVVTLCWVLIGYSMSFGPVAVPSAAMNVDPAMDFSSWDASLAAPGATRGTQVIGNVQLALLTFGDSLRQGGWTTQSYYNDGAAPIYLTITETTFCMFQLMFAIITVALISGSVVGKIKYIWWLAFTAAWHLLVYCPLAHWIFFYDGWLFRMGLLDYAGGMVVHASSGISGLVLAFWLGHGRPKRPKPEAHAVPYVLLGAALLWFGWFGFNAGSSLSAASNVTARVFANTHIASASAMLTWGFMEIIFSGQEYFRGHPSAVGAATGAVVGLVAITPSCGYVSQMWAIFIGFFTVLICFFAPRIARTCFIDDALDGFAIHGVGGTVGAILTGLFASKKNGDSAVDGTFFGNTNLVIVQLQGIALTALVSIAGTTVIFWTLQLFAWTIGSDVRIDEAIMDDEIDSSEHGERAYGRKPAEQKSSAHENTKSLALTTRHLPAAAAVGSV